MDDRRDSTKTLRLLTYGVLPAVVALLGVACAILWRDMAALRRGTPAPVPPATDARPDLEARLAALESRRAAPSDAELMERVLRLEREAAQSGGGRSGATVLQPDDPRLLYIPGDQTGRESPAGERPAELTARQQTLLDLGLSEKSARAFGAYMGYWETVLDSAEQRGDEAGATAIHENVRSQARCHLSPDEIGLFRANFGRLWGLGASEDEAAPPVTDAPDLPPLPQPKEGKKE